MQFTVKARKVCVCGAEIVVFRQRGPRGTCKPCLKRAAQDRFKENNPGRKEQLRRNWLEANREKDRQIKAEWQKANPHVEAAKQARRRAKKLLATPQWFDPNAAESIYELARIWSEATGVQYHVDHIVPLQGHSVCGLHWHGNLQILPAAVNRAKSNKLEGNP